jgi:glycosyltransferase involved in cell wall biosynthesis
MSVQAVDKPWRIDDAARTRLGKFPEVNASEAKHFDIVLQIGNPLASRRYPVPTIMFTCCDTSDLPPNQIDKLRNADAMIAPNKANLEIYRKHFTRVYLAQPAVDEHFFVPRKDYRVEGSEVFTFFFVGSYSFRKGVDVLVDCFLSEFSPSQACLHLHLPGEQTNRAANDINARMNVLGRLGRFTLSSDNLSEAWMARSYNRADCFITCTRGEGWGLPLIEALLCGLPVVSPFTTGMADFLNDDIAFPIKTSFRKAADLTDPFGANFKTTYGFGAVGFEEPDPDSVRQQMRRAYESRDTLPAMGLRGRAHILSAFNENRFAEQIAEALISLTTLFDKRVAASGN